MALRALAILAAAVASALFGICAAAAADFEVAVHDLGDAPLQDAVIYAEPVGGVSGGTPVGHEVAYAKIDQVNKEFVPLVSVVRTNTDVSFPNSDNFRHSIYSFSQPKAFTTKLYSGKQAPPVRFDKPGLVVLGCNIHDMMAAWVVIVDTPYFTKTAASGTGLLKGLVPGDYKLSIWYPGPRFEPTTSQVHVTADGTNHLDIAVDSAGSPLPALRARAAPAPGKAKH
jgi:plastocyanin